MRRLSHPLQSGMTMIELLVALGILSFLFMMTTKTFQTANSGEALDTNALKVSAELNEARSLTLSSKNADQFGVHFATSSITLFEGTSFVSGSATNTVSTLNPLVQISSITLSGGGSDVIFQRLTGKTSQSGTITLSLIGSPSSTKTITIYATGIVQMP